MLQTARGNGNYTEVGKVLIEQNIHNLLDAIDELALGKTKAEKVRQAIVSAFSNGMQLGGMSMAEVEEWTSKYR